MLMALGTPPLSLAFARQVVEFLKVKLRATAGGPDDGPNPRKCDVVWTIERNRVPDDDAPIAMRVLEAETDGFDGVPSAGARSAKMQPCVDQPQPAPCVNCRFVMAPNMTPATSSSALNARPMPSSSSRSKTAFGPASAKQAGQSASPTIRRLSDNATDLSDAYTAAAAGSA